MRRGPATAGRSGRGTLIWDLPLRLSHWGLAAAVLGAYLTERMGPAAFRWHALFGYAVLVLALFRIAWGWLGPRHAQFSDFVRGPRAALAYLGRQGPNYVGHNPIGGWMVLLLLALLLAAAASGLPANDAIMNAGPLYGLVTPEQSDAFTHWHARLWPVLVAAIVAHIGAALLYLWPGGSNLIAPLVTGYRRDVAPDQGIVREYRWRALTILVILIVLLVAGLALAPPADLVPLSAAQCSSSRYLSWQDLQFCASSGNCCLI
jgi:cytochrome b